MVFRRKCGITIIVSIHDNIIVRDAQKVISHRDGKITGNSHYQFTPLKDVKSPSGTSGCHRRYFIFISVSIGSGSQGFFVAQIGQAMPQDQIKIYIVDLLVM